MCLEPSTFFFFFFLLLTFCYMQMQCASITTTTPSFPLSLPSSFPFSLLPFKREDEGLRMCQNMSLEPLSFPLSLPPFKREDEGLRTCFDVSGVSFPLPSLPLPPITTIRHKLLRLGRPFAIKIGSVVHSSPFLNPR